LVVAYIYWWEILWPEGASSAKLKAHIQLPLFYVVAT
jgi:hypothetical protein